MGTVGYDMDTGKIQRRYPLNNQQAKGTTIQERFQRVQSVLNNQTQRRYNNEKQESSGT